MIRDGRHFVHAHEFSLPLSFVAVVYFGIVKGSWVGTNTHPCPYWIAQKLPLEKWFNAAAKAAVPSFPAAAALRCSP